MSEYAKTVKVLEALGRKVHSQMGLKQQTLSVERYLHDTFKTDTFVKKWFRESIVVKIIKTLQRLKGL